MRKELIYLFSSSEISACSFKCHFSDCWNSWRNRSTFVCVVLISSTSTSPLMTDNKPSSISVTSSMVKVSSINLSEYKVQSNDLCVTACISEWVSWWCVCVCVCVCMCVCVCVYFCACVFFGLCVYVSVCVCAYMCVSTSEWVIHNKYPFSFM